MPKAVQQNSTSLTRRSIFIKSVATLPLVAVSACGSTAAFQPANSAASDAELIEAWSAYLDANRALDALPVTGKDGERASCMDAVIAASERVEQIPARTKQGIAIKLRYLFAEYLETEAALNVSLYGMPVTEDMVEDNRDRTLWNLIKNVESMA